MQKILDGTQGSLAGSFASLARNARRQRTLYLSAIVTLMVIVVVSALLLAALAINRQLDYRRSLVTQYAADISLLLHDEVSFLRRTELTVSYYQQTDAPRSLPAGVDAAIRQSGVASGDGGTVGTRFDVLVPSRTRETWGDALDEKLWRLYESGQSTLVTQQTFDLNHRAMLIGLRDDYALIMPSVVKADGSVPPLQPGDAVTLRSVLLHELQSETGLRVLAKNRRLWVGPYVDPLLRVPVITALSFYYDGDTPAMLLAISLPVDTLIARLHRPSGAGVLALLSDQRRVVVASPPVDAATSDMMAATAAALPDGDYIYTRDGALIRESIMPGFGSLVGYLAWGALAATLGWQLGVIAGVALILLVGIALTARFWGLRLLARSHEEAVRALENEAINHVLVSVTPVGLCIVRRSDFSILTANALARELLHLEPAGVALPPHLAQVFQTEMLMAANDAHTTMQVGAADDAGVVVFRAPALAGQASAGDANPQVLQWTCAPARYGGEAVLFCAVLDVTTQHTLEAQLRAAQQETEATMRARSTFFASMSHEIRTPLNVLLGNLEMLALAPGLEAHEQRLLSLKTAAGSLRHIVNDILDFSKIDAGEMKLVIESFRPIDDLENLALSYAPMLAERPIRFYSHLSPTLDQVLCGDRTRIAQVVNNLLSNAYKFTSCGKIVLNAEVHEDAQERSVLHCRVYDSGIGMDPVQVARIFHPFVQGESSTASRYGGTGLGLSICASLCELMGGQISVESVQGVGTAFSVSIPLTLPPENERVPVALPARRGNALVLCQEIESGEIISGWLDSAGWFARSVSSVRTADESLRANRPDVLVVTGEHDVEVITALRAVQQVGAVWITRRGPHRPTLRVAGVLEVSEFSHRAILSAVEMAVQQQWDRAVANDMSVANAAVASAPDVATRAVLPHENDAPLQMDSSAEKPLQGLAILVAEDNPLNQTLIVEQLTALGCEPILAGDGRQALAMLERHEVDVVLTDIHMPVMDGYELLAALRRQYPGLPVMAFSAVTDVQQADEWQQLGFTGHISKPTSLKELETALDALGASEPLSTAASAASSVTPDAGTDIGLALDAATQARYVAMLKDHLGTDLPRLSAIVERCDRPALRDWAHSAAGAFLIVGEPRFAAQCRELQNLCQTDEHWNAHMATLAMTLHEGLRQHFGLDVASMH
ncbi:ATP-binding protein [Paraburkholderia sp. DHOC27]|uniref:ATP-binding protein n=1 Tax=Paraburkholderia sp. DHOC27 TaxID=2303330 RepID=UPI000E3BFC64|nr:ATP-binding protein [Paraburkholderia sp. DHOC27]RFU48709.1 response regulator [Paraburkholderia sp. DHOC27]